MGKTLLNVNISKNPAKRSGYAEDLYANVTAHNRVAGRLGRTEKPTQFDLSMAILKEFMAQIA